ncbi:hypothetical protein EVAR_72439_1, partial [Eumeta japonica]
MNVTSNFAISNETKEIEVGDTEAGILEILNFSVHTYADELSSISEMSAAYRRAERLRQKQLKGLLTQNNKGYEPTERTYLLADPINNSPALRRTNSDNISNDYAHSLPKKDDQNALCRLVQNTAINMIDVGAMDSHNLEHQECDDRIKLYSQRLQQQWSNVQHPSNVQTGKAYELSLHPIQFHANTLPYLV